MKNDNAKNSSHEVADPRIRVSDDIIIYRRGKRRTWTADYHIMSKNGRGRHGRKSLATRHRRIAEQRARKLQEKIERRELELEAPVSVRIDAAAEQFVQSKEAESRAPKTIMKYRSELRMFADYLKNSHAVTMLRSVTIRHVDLYKIHRKDEDSLDTYTLYNVVIVLKTFFKWVRIRNLIRENPLAELRVSMPRRRRHPAATIQQVNATLGQTKGILLAIFATLAFSGLRVGELMTLRCIDVDLAVAVIHIRRREDWGPKTQSSERDVPIHRRLLAILMALPRSKGEYFFSAPPSRQFPDGDHQINPRDVNEAFQAAAVRCGYQVGRDAQGLTLHALRRFFKTFTLDAGVPKPMADAWLGHVDQDSMDFFYYDTQQSKEWMQRVSFGEPDDGELKRLKGDEGNVQ